MELSVCVGPCSPIRVQSLETSTGMVLHSRPACHQGCGGLCCWRADGLCFAPCSPSFSS